MYWSWFNLSKSTGLCLILYHTRWRASGQLPEAAIGEEKPKKEVRVRRLRNCFLWRRDKPAPNFLTVTNDDDRFFFIKRGSRSAKMCASARAPAFSATRAINKRRHLAFLRLRKVDGWERVAGRSARAACVCVRRGLIKSCSESAEENMKFAGRRTPRRALPAGNNCLYDKLLLCYLWHLLQRVFAARPHSLAPRRPATGASKLSRFFN